ncbi:MAG: TetR/AcrR family transcriptional regulator [Pseudomonadota bacterium]
MNEADARARRSRDSLLDAGLTMLARNPAASMTDVANLAGVGRATLYRHFPSRTALVRELARECLRRTDADLAPVADAGLRGRRALEAVIQLIMPLARQFHFLLSLWSYAEDDEDIRAIYDRQLTQLVTLVEEAKAEGSIDAAVPAAWVVSSLDAQVAAAWWMVGNGLFTDSEAAEAVIRSLFDGIGPRA